MAEEFARAGHASNRVPIPEMGVMLGAPHRARSNAHDSNSDWKSAILSAPDYPAVRRRNLTGPLPLSFGQRRIWFLSQMELGSLAYNVPLGWRVRGKISDQVL